VRGRVADRSSRQQQQQQQHSCWPSHHDVVGQKHSAAIRWVAGAVLLLGATKHAYNGRVLLKAVVLPMSRSPCVGQPEMHVACRTTKRGLSNSSHSSGNSKEAVTILKCCSVCCAAACAAAGLSPSRLLSHMMCRSWCSTHATMVSHTYISSSSCSSSGTSCNSSSSNGRGSHPS
jgi:hypothetical protein